MADWEDKDHYSDISLKALVKDFKFNDFKSALVFVNKVGELAEKANHHPDINLGWGYVRIWLTSHDTHAITPKDHDLARAIDQILI